MEPLNKYPKYKPSNIQWIGDIPEHWNFLQIKRLTNVKRGASPRPIDDPKYFDDNGEFSWVRISDVTASERYLLNTTQTLSELGASLSVKRYSGDFFLSIAGTVGKPIITKIKCCIHDGFVWFPNLKINPEYLYYIFSTGLPYQGLGKWGTQLNLNTETVGDIYIPLPDENEIESLVNFLDKKTSQLTTLIANKQKLIKLLKEERIAIINEAVSGEGKNWVKKKLKYLAKLRDEIIDNTDFKIAVENIESASGRLVNMQEEKNYEGHLSAFRKGDTIFNKLRPYLHKVYFAEKDGGLFGELLIFYSLGELIPEFLYYKLFSKEFIDIVDGSTQGTKMPRANWNDFISQLVIFYPISKNEQTSIVLHIQEETKRIDNTISKIEKEIELLQEYKVALISEVVTGKVKIV